MDDDIKSIRLWQAGRYDMVMEPEDLLEMLGRLVDEIERLEGVRLEAVELVEGLVADNERLTAEVEQWRKFVADYFGEPVTSSAKIRERLGLEATDG